MFIGGGQRSIRAGSREEEEEEELRMKKRRRKSKRWKRRVEEVKEKELGKRGEGDEDAEEELTRS